ncbi:hypothetical protein ACFVRR_13820 [Gottfriedia sp. NPDC057948]|uniref:hypothetical protein n=1 Tax=Gottfriedia sp. NPDC057948 TaxID=3346287 RepID=UPI0036DC51C3
MDTIGVIGTNSLQYDGTEKIAFSVTCIAVSWIWFLSLAIAGRTAGKVNLCWLLIKYQQLSFGVLQFTQLKA